MQKRSADSTLLLKIKQILSPEILQIATTFQKANEELYMVGGAVRDAILGRSISDIDFATSCRPEKVATLFKSVIPTGIEHGTVTLLINGKSFEVTTYRADGKYSDGRRPDSIEYAKSIEEDLSRRDFTINAFAYHVLEETLIDLFDGLSDLDQKIIKTIGDPETRFNEDYLRMLRACRFASQLKFTIDPLAITAIQKNAKKLENISQERVREEFSKIVLSKKPSVGLDLCETTGLLSIFLPELSACKDVEQNRFHKYDVYWHCLHVLDAVNSSLLTHRLAGLFHDIAKPLCKKEITEKEEPVFYNHEVVGAGVTKKIMKRLKFSNDEIKEVAHFIRGHMFHYTRDWTKGAVRRFVRNAGVENIDTFFMLRDADRIGNGKRDNVCSELVEFREKIAGVIAEDSAFQIKDLHIDGNILMKELNITPSPLIGKILETLLQKVLDDPTLNETETLIGFAKEAVEKNEFAPPPERD